MRFLPLLLVSLLGLSGCAVVGDVTASTAGDHGNCEIHHRRMSIGEVPCHAGSSVYLREFQKARAKEFPHHGRSRFAEDHGYLGARRLRLHICPECTKAYDR